jgi:hypothetical protein
VKARAADEVKLCRRYMAFGIYCECVRKKLAIG